MYQIPILLITFNRPDLTKLVLEAIIEQQPLSLYIFQDGARDGNFSDVQKCNDVRSIINTPMDWNCELHTYFSGVNLGCGQGPATAINWFFQHVEEGIVLEDDILPDPSFFQFMKELIYRYRNDDRISMVTGLNLLGHWKQGTRSYIFSNFGGTAGWASWRRVWQSFDYQMGQWQLETAKTKLDVLFGKHVYVDYFKRVFDFLSQNISNSFWDYQWMLTRFLSGGCTIVPTVNLITNIGFGEDATHTKVNNHPQAFIKGASIPLPLKHYPYKIDKIYDRYIFERFMNPKKRSLLKRIFLKIMKIITRTEREKIL